MDEKRENEIAGILSRGVLRTRSGVSQSGPRHGRRSLAWPTYLPTCSPRAEPRVGNAEGHDDPTIRLHMESRVAHRSRRSRCGRPS
jgi:hypothetical protein